MTNHGEWDDDDFQDPRLFRYATGEELLAELEAAEAKQARDIARRRSVASQHHPSFLGKMLRVIAWG